MNKKGNCLYLLGAGASCEVLPLVSEFEKYNGLGILDHWLSYTFDAKIISGEKK